MKLSIVIPCYNERATIEAILDAVRAAPWPDKEIIVVDDCSRDGTRDLLEGELAHQVDRLVLPRPEPGQGRRAAHRLRARDRRHRHRPGRRPRVRPAASTRRSSSRSSTARPTWSSARASWAAKPHRVLYFWHTLGNRLLTLLSNMFTNLNLTDMETCYKVFRREIIQKITIEENRFGFEPEITAKVARMGCRIYEVGISLLRAHLRGGQEDRLADGFRAIYCIVKYNLFR